MAVLVLFASACSNSPAPPQAAETPAGATNVLTVEGMSCAVNCAPSVKESLESIDGVKRADVSFEEKRAVVVMAQGHVLTTEIADKSFGNDGYFVSEIVESESDPEQLTDSEESATSPQS